MGLYWERPLVAIIKYHSGRVVKRFVGYGFYLKSNMKHATIYDRTTGKKFKYLGDD